MFELRVEGEFSSSHQLYGYKGKCEELQGHNWRVEMYVKGEKLNEIGLLVDFKDLRELLKKTLDHLDHKFLNRIKPFDSINPSAENIAKFIYENVQAEINKLGIILSKIIVFETSKSMACYSKD